MNIKLGCSPKVIIFAIVLFGFTHFGTDALTSPSDVTPGPAITPLGSGSGQPPDKGTPEASPLHAPIGFHDYDSGDVPRSACNVAGWAIDPDDPYQEVNVRILVDGIPLSQTFKAESYREDLETSWKEGSGGCPNGTCAFVVNLWNFVSHYQTHEITVEAQDLQTGEWFPLSATPKELTCRTYDIYSFGPLAGATQQVTGLPGYPTLSPSPGATPKMDIRVNYGHDWVESFYEAGHTVWVTLTTRDGQTKATNKATTLPRSDWGGEPGFQTIESPWFDPGGNLMKNPPDIQPGDWVFAWVDNGATAQVQIGEIRGLVSYDKDSVSGTILASWLTGSVHVECLDWRAANKPPASNKDGGFVSANGTETYTCSWDPAEWDVQPWQDIGVGYLTPEGHWVANAFRDERWMAFWTGDLASSSWSSGEHTYHIHMNYKLPEPGGDRTSPSQTLSVSSIAPLYPGKVLLQTVRSAPPLAWTGNGCKVVTIIQPDQATRFVWGWVNDYSMAYEEALAHFSSMAVEAFWDGDAGSSTPLKMGELHPWNPNDTSSDYRCSLTGFGIK